MYEVRAELKNLSLGCPKIIEILRIKKKKILENVFLALRDFFTFASLVRKERSHKAIMRFSNGIEAYYLFKHFSYKEPHCTY